MAGNTGGTCEAVRRKRLRYHIAKRANLEVETILNHFWNRHGHELTSEELDDLERLLKLEDLDLLDMFYSRKSLSDRRLAVLLTKIINTWKEKRK